MKYDIIIPVAFRDYPFLKNTITYIEEYLEPDRIFIITNYDKSCCLPYTVRKDKKCFILNEDIIIPNISLKKVSQWLTDHKSINKNAGWFFQQFIKMGFASSEYCHNDYYLSWDADTLPIRHIDFFDKDERPFFSMKSEHHQPYYDTIKKLLSIPTINKQSYIAEHMMFNKKIMNILINKISQNLSFNGDNWVEKIINATNPNEYSPFSEFETYGNFCNFYFSEQYIERYLPSFRGGAFISGRFVSDRILKEISLDTFTISFEIYHNPRFPWNLINYSYNKIIQYLKYKEFILKNKFNK